MKPRGLFGSFAHVFVSRPERVQSSAAPVIVPAAPPFATSEMLALSILEMERVPTLAEKTRGSDVAENYKEVPERDHWPVALETAGSWVTPDKSE